MSAEDGIIRSISEGDMFVPQQGWQFLDDEGFLVQWAYCGLDCPNGFTFTTDDTLKVSHHRLDKKEIMIAVKLLGIIVFPLTIISLMVTGLGLYKLCL